MLPPSFAPSPTSDLEGSTALHPPSAAKPARKLQWQMDSHEQRRDRRNRRKEVDSTGSDSLYRRSTPQDLITKGKYATKSTSVASIEYIAWDNR